MHTSPFGEAESFNIRCTVEIFDDLGQLSVHFFDHLGPLWVD